MLIEHWCRGGLVRRHPWCAGTNQSKCDLRRPPHEKLLVFCFVLAFAVDFPVLGQEIPNAVTALEEAVSSSIARTEKSVVAISRGPKDEDDAPENGKDPFVAEEYGTGVVIDARGFILTNYHLLGDPTQSQYEVTLPGKKPVPAKIKAADPWTDLAVLEVETNELTPIRFAADANLHKGKFVVALGNPYGILDEGSPTASFGIIANLTKLRPRENEASKTIYQHGQLIQCDAKSMAGGSGGPLVDLHGKMIGLVTSVEAISGYDQAGSYAIHINQRMLRVIERLKSGRAPEFGFLGINPQSIDQSVGKATLDGIKIGESDIFRHTPAAKAGLQLHDIITHFNGTPVRDPDHLVCLVSFSTPGEKVKLSIRRADPFLRRMRPLSREVSLAKRPAVIDRVPISSAQGDDWRGIRVDYATVSKDFYELANRLPRDGAVFIVSVRSDSIGSKAGLRQGDLIATIDEASVSNPAEFRDAVRDSQAELKFEVIRHNGSREIIAIPAEIP